MTGEGEDTSSFRVSTGTQDGRQVITPEGELDLVTAPLVERRLTEVMPAGTVTSWQIATGGILVASHTSVAAPVNDRLLTLPTAWMVSVPMTALL